MHEINYTPKRIIIEKPSVDDSLTKDVIVTFPRVPHEVVENAFELLKSGRFGTETLFLARNRGAFVKSFEPSKGAPPCQEMYITPIMNCPFKCSYCYLQSYLDYNSIVIFTNTNDMIKEVKKHIEENTAERFTTGEFSDSLALEHITATAKRLLPLFAEGSSKLELRTKSIRIENITGLFDEPSFRDLKKKLIITWTLASPEAIIKEEAGTASTEERINAIARTLEAGIAVGIRFDPIIPFYYSVHAYEEVLIAIASNANNKLIKRVELGVLRFPAGLMELIGRQSNKKNILRGEFIRNREGKHVLYRPIRLKIYRELIAIIKRHLPSVSIQLSMEDYDSWEDVGLNTNRDLTGTAQPQTD